MQANNEKTTIALKQASSEVSLFVVDVEKEVAAVEKQFLSVVPDCSTREGYDFSKSVRGEVLPIKSGIEKARKTLKEPVIEMGKLIDSSLKPLITRLESVYKPHEEAYRAKDNEKKLREEARQAKIQQAFDSINNIALEAMGQTSTVIETMIDELADFDFDPDVFQERTEEAVLKHSEVMGKLADMLTAQIAVEEREAEAEAQRKRIAEVEAREAAVKAKEEAEAKAIEQAKRDKEIRAQAEKEAEERHKAELLAAEQRAKQQAEAAAQAERDKAEAIKQQELAEAKKREADKNHRAAINRDILSAILTTGITEEQAKAIICMAAKGQAGNMTINY